MKNRITISVLANDSDYYRAELLLFSLEHFASVDCNKILIISTMPLGSDFMNFLESKGVAHRLLNRHNNQSFGIQLATGCFALSNQYYINYQGKLSSFGLLASNNIKAEELDRANQAISNKANFEFYAAFKRSQVLQGRATTAMVKFDQGLADLLSNRATKLKLILHIGTPKTGTTSIQVFMHEHRNQLHSQGILYPDNYSHDFPPKHQWLVHALRVNDHSLLLNRFATILNQAEASIHTIFLSTEGIYNNWFDFPLAAKDCFKVLSRHFELQFWLWLRHPVAFLYSYFKQNLKNARQDNYPCYGQDLSFEQMLQDDWFIKHMDYTGYLLELESLVARQNIQLFKYSDNVLEELADSLCIKIGSSTQARENIALADVTINLMRHINQLDLPAKNKHETVQLLKEINQIIAPYSQNQFINPNTQQMINQNHALSRHFIAQHYSLEI